MRSQPCAPSSAYSSLLPSPPWCECRPAPGWTIFSRLPGPAGKSFPDGSPIRSRATRRHPTAPVKEGRKPGVPATSSRTTHASTTSDFSRRTCRARSRSWSSSLRAPCRIYCRRDGRIHLIPHVDPALESVRRHGGRHGRGQEGRTGLRRDPGRLQRRTRDRMIVL